MPEDHDTNPLPEDFHFKGTPVAKSGTSKLAQRNWFCARSVPLCIRVRLRYRRLKRKLAQGTRMCFKFFTKHVIPLVRRFIVAEIKRREEEVRQRRANATKTLAEASETQTKDAILKEELAWFTGKPQVGNPDEMAVALRRLITETEGIIRKGGRVGLLRVQLELLVERSDCDLSANPVLRDLLEKLLQIASAHEPSPQHVLSGVDRRRDARSPLSGTVLVSRSRTLGADLTLCRNISRGGLYVLLPAPSPVGYEVGQEARLEFKSLDPSSPVTFDLRIPRNGTIVRIDRSGKTSAATNSIGLAIEFDTPLNEPIHAS